ncbi:MAG TPA: hypothetical protein PLC54_06240 [Spirochaetales bacterium]|nr:hypothetical protein [Spirochaetales bacterium]
MKNESIVGARIPAGMLAAIRARAKRNNRSLSGEIRHLAELGLAAEIATQDGKLPIGALEEYRVEQ